MKIYDIYVRHLGSENALYWSRSQLMFAAITALTVFTVKEASPFGGAQWPSLIKDSVLTIVGLFLVVIWGYAISAGETWLLHWRSILTDLEAVTFKNVDPSDWPIGGAPPREPRARSSRVPKFLVYLLGSVWCLLLIYTAIGIGFKLGSS
jgi:hypothetical protein